MLTPDRHIPCLDDVTAEAFADIVRAARPVVLKNVAGTWPLVRAARQSDQAAADYLKTLDSHRAVQVWIGEPDIDGRFFYGSTLDKLNFRKIPASISATLDHLLNQAGETQPRSVYIQSLPAADYLPDFRRDHTLGLIPDVPPRIWIGNRLRVQTHYDPVENIAVLAAGRRRFTLFAPDQLPNLYPGPLEKTVAGAPVSMAAIENPDFERFPRLKAAIDNAFVTELEPGDGIYIPYMWWHHVQSLTPFNVLVNYWWDPEPALNAEAMDAFMHAVLALRHQPKARRDIWQAMFDYYLFSDDPLGHLDPADRGAIGGLSDADKARMRQHLANKWRQ